jgi:hypothetical protein
VRRRQFRNKALDLPLEAPFDVRELCARIGVERVRPIVLLGVQLASHGVSGLWLATDKADLICYEANTSKPHQEHIILHELGHILHGHGGSSTVSDALAPLFPALEPDALRIMLARRHHTYAADEERQAEDFAYIVLARANQGIGTNGSTRLSQVLEG